MKRTVYCTLSTSRGEGINKSERGATYKIKRSVSNYIFEGAFLYSHTLVKHQKTMPT